MASLEDYDEFGNYIGADLGSDEEAENLLPEEFQQRLEEPPQPLEGLEPEAREEQMALMELDGMFDLFCIFQSWFLIIVIQNQSTGRLFCTRIRSTILQLRKFTDRMWKRLYKKKIRSHYQSLSSRQLKLGNGRWKKKTYLSRVLIKGEGVNPG